MDPDLVKALIASESGFNPEPKPQSAGRAGKARGSMQLTDQAVKILADEKGELKNHLVNISQEETLNPNANICAGIRWLFRKRSLASARLKRTATWEEGVAEYKAYLRDMISGKDPNPKGMKVFKEKYGALKKK
ncbi:MAG: transglycosylase SLT domain-containing protein [Bdellovibrionota bacterium]